MVEKKPKISPLNNLTLTNLTENNLKYNTFFPIINFGVTLDDGLLLGAGVTFYKLSGFAKHLMRTNKPLVSVLPPLREHLTFYMLPILLMLLENWILYQKSISNNLFTTIGMGWEMNPSGFPTMKHFIESGWNNCELRRY